MLRGYIGLAQTPPARDPGVPRLQPGPAFGRAAGGTLAETSEDWPLYRHDRYRSGATEASLPSRGLRVLWQLQVESPPTGSLAAEWNDDPFVRGAITPPVCASETVVLAVPDRHRVVALNAKMGTRRWSFTAGGRIDTPPTIAGGLCLFGAHDGYVYCLSLADGQLAWRFRAAPQEARIAVYGQMESLWPVPGSVLTDGGVAYFAAGRHPASDGGVHVMALRIGDGKILWEKTVTDTGIKRWYGGTLPDSKIKVGLDYEPVDLMVRDGDAVAMSRWRFEPLTGQMTLALASTNYEAFGGLEVPRGVWGYGIRQTKQVLDKLPAVFDAQEITLGTTNETALLLADMTKVSSSSTGQLKIGQRAFSLDAPALHDGLVVAKGRLYAATRGGKLYCIGRE
jgi:outer membrane protein assembly factor BamB